MKSSWSKRATLFGLQLNNKESQQRNAGFVATSSLAATLSMSSLQNDVRLQNMSSFVVDASVILAFLLDEPGHEKVTADILSSAVVSAVNIAEVQTILVRKGGIPEEAWTDALSTVREVVPFTEDHAKLSGSLVAQTAPLGLSLGDRACLALGVILSVPIYTADREWKKLKLNAPIRCIR
jgi:PIN domain nuclease of toxin-antitoxin system